MNNTVHIWFNGRGVYLPANNDWEKFGEVDALRTFLICANSWTRNGWQVKRLITSPLPIMLNNVEYAPEYIFTPTPFLPNGRAASAYWWYPSEMWQYIAKCKAVVEPGFNLFVSMDVINNGLLPEYLKNYDENLGCVSFQKEHFSLSAFMATPNWLIKAENVLLAYDRGELPEIRSNYVSDERILRDYLPGFNAGGQKFACALGYEYLIHFSRSSLAQQYRAIPLS